MKSLKTLKREMLNDAKTRAAYDTLADEYAIARELIAARDGVPLMNEAVAFPHIFYRVEGEGKNAWVSEWCVARP